MGINISENNSLSPNDFYDVMAEYYDNHIAKTRLNTLSLEEEKRFIEYFISKDDTILDLGCGTGRTMQLLQHPTRKIFGIDISENMVKIAQTKVKNVTKASFCKLPFKNNYFDFIYSIHMGFGYCKNHSEMFDMANEIYRVLKNEAKILLDSPYFLNRGKEYLIEWNAGNDKIELKGYGKDQNEIKDVLNKVGFSNYVFYGNYNVKDELTDKSKRIIVYAEKRSTASNKV